MPETTIMSGYDAEQMFDDLMEDSYGEIDVCGFKMSALRVLKEMDPIAYRECFLDWANCMADDGTIIEGVTD